MSEDLSRDKKMPNYTRTRVNIRPFEMLLWRWDEAQKNTRNYSSILTRRKERERKVLNFIWHGSQESTSSDAKKIEKTLRQHNKVKT